MKVASVEFTTATSRRFVVTPLQLRLAFGRLDWATNENTDIFFEAAQDWTIFGSSGLMNLFETTFLGAYWGNLYERSPQFRFGVVQQLGGSRNFKLSPEFAIMMPSEGNLPGDAVTSACTTTATPSIATGFTTTCTNTVVNGSGNQLGYGERQGADYAAPELETRVVLQFQADDAPGVVPAPILSSGFCTIARRLCWRPPFRFARLARAAKRSTRPLSRGA